MSKKVFKVEEPPATYPAKPTAAPSPAAPKTVGTDKIRASNARLLAVHKDVLQKLAQ